MPTSKATRPPAPRETRVVKQQEPRVLDAGWTVRVVTEDELLQEAQKDPDLDLTACRDILARLNTKASFHVSEDIRKERELKVPNDFAAYKNWTPLPRHISQITSVPKFILVAKEIPFLGWYEKGELKGDTYICIGKKWDMTESGMYKVEDKHADHYSRSYPNAFGQPAWMPWSLRIYGTVYIHAGDITGGYCSPGCIVLPLATAEKLYYWASVGTPVLVLDSLKDLQSALKNHQKQLASGR
jgi:hypothetical protein